MNKNKWFRESHRDILYFTLRNEDYEEMTINKKEICKEIIKLLKAKKKLGFNESWGVGEIQKAGDFFVVIKHYYGKLSYPVNSVNVIDVVNWLLEFSKINEPFDYNRAMSAAFAKDIERIQNE